jgi:hypothetical protein
MWQVRRLRDERTGVDAGGDDELVRQRGRHLPEQ